jgi:hypothetical protein
MNFDETWKYLPKGKDMDFDWLSRPNMKTEIRNYVTVHSPTNALFIKLGNV